MSTSITYSVIVPVYNSENSLSELCTRIVNTLSQYSFEIILVDDGSSDNSWQIIEELKKKYPASINAVRLQKNYGQHAALLCAFSFCHGSFVITIDDDLQYSPEDILLLIQKQKDTDAGVVYGIVSNKQHSAIKKLGSYYIKQTSGLAGSSFKVIKKSIIDTILDKHRYNFIFLDEVLQWYTPFFAFVEVTHSQRLSGKSGYNFLMLARLYLNITTNYSAVPLKLLIYIGGVSSFISFCIGISSVYHKMVHNTPMGYTSIIVAILFSTSVIMFCLGIIGLYLVKIYLAQQNKPIYTIKQIIK